MSEQIDRRISFNAGEISPWLDPRLDLEKYQMGCRQLQNIRPMIYGGALKRAGTQYVGRALNDSTAVRLIPWIGAEGQHYVIELSHLKVRIWDADTLVLEDSLVEMEWNPNTAYVAETVVSFEGQRYEVVVDHTSNAGEVGYEFIGTSLDPEIDSGIFEPTGNIVNGYPEYGFFDPNRGNLGSNYLLQQNFFNDGWNLLLEDVETSNSPLGWASLPNDIGYYDPDQATSWANSNGLGTITAVNKITVGPGQGLQADIEAGNLRPYPSRELATVFTSEQLAEIQYAQQNDVMYLTHPDHQPQVILRTPSDWLMGDVKFDWPATLGPNITPIRLFPLLNIYNSGEPAAWSNATTYAAGAKVKHSGAYYQSIRAGNLDNTPGTGDGEIWWAKGTWVDAAAPAEAPAYVNTTKYVTGQRVLYNGQVYVRSASFSGKVRGYNPRQPYTYVTNSGRVPKRNTVNLWELLSNAGAGGANEMVVKGETIDLLATEDLFLDGHVGTTWLVSHNRVDPKSTLNIKDASVGDTSEPIFVLGAFSITLALTAADTDLEVELVIEQSRDMVEWETYSGVRADGTSQQQIIAGNLEEPMFLRAKLLSKANVTPRYLCEITPASAVHTGLVTIVSVEDSTHATATVVIPLYRPWPTARWEEPAFSTVRGYPKAVCLHDGRLWFGGTFAKPTTVWGSTVDAYWDYRLGPEDDRALQYTLAADESSTVEWLVSQDLLVIGTSTSEWALGQRPGDDAIQLRRNTSYGSGPIQARAISESVIFIQKSRRKLREFAWSFERDGYLANDLTMLAEHLGDAEMRQIAIGRNPDAAAYVVTVRGDLLVLVHERGQNVNAWARLVTDGDIESVAVLPATVEEDHVWMVVARQIDDATVRYVERIAPDQLRALKTGERSELIFSDAAVVATPAERVVSGLEHLEGRSVVILADGAVHRPLTVEQGAVTLDYPATVAVVGLPYTAVLEPTWVESPDVAGWSKAGKKRIHRVVSEFWKSAGMEISTDGGASWQPMETRAAGELMDGPRALFTGLREDFVDGRSDRQISCIVRSADPLPMLVQSLHIRYQIDAK